MPTSTVEMQVPNADQVSVTDTALTVELSDGRVVSAPLSWFPRLVHATYPERSHWRLVGKGLSIHWEDLDEDISVEGLLVGRPSGESQASLQRWLQQRGLAQP